MTFITIADFVADGLADNFAVPFPYLAEAHVIVTVDGAPVTRTFTSPEVVRLDTTPLSGQIVRVRRQTPVDRLLVVINSRSSVRSTEINALALQLLYLIQEGLDASLDFQSTLLDRSIELSVSGLRLAQGERSAPFVAGTPHQLEAGLPGSRFVTFTPPEPSDPYTFAIFRNDAEIGDVEIREDGSTTINFPSAVVFGRGDAISFVITGPDMNDIGATLQGTLI